MKTVGIILIVCVLQAWTLPRMEQLESQKIAPHESITVAEFRAAIDYHFGHYNDFYDATNEAMTRYRLEHVSRIRENYQGLMREFGYTVEDLRRRTGNQNTANFAINACARRANATYVDALSTYFYPTFRLVQENTSLFPLMTLDALRRGNVFAEPGEILEYLEIQYEAFLIQWLQTVSKFFRWEKNKADVNGDFYKEEMNLCLCVVVPESARCGQSPIPTLVQI